MKRNRKQGGSRNRAGLTLIEILVSLAILAGALSVILQAFARGASTLALAKNRLRAYHFSLTKLSELEADPLHMAPEAGEGSFRIGHDQFAWQVATSLLPEEPSLAVVTLTTSWQQSGRAQAVRVSGLWPAPPVEGP